MRTSRMIAAALSLSLLASEPAAAAPAVDTSRGDRMIAEYFRLETAKLRQGCLAEVHSKEDWEAKRGRYRQQLLEMLGLDPLPERTDLAAVVTDRVERDEFAVEKVHFQSRPGLYVTGNLYLPKGLKEPAPAILYLCGHGGVKKNGISYGNKVSYQHHGCWLARHGYICLMIDSLQLGEIEGIHHGTYREKRWWWNTRGYTPAGVEAWNCVRALDYLQSRKEVDPKRLGATGRSGGGAYSWWIAAIDDRIRAAAPVAGITDLTNLVVDGCIEGHCDCMFMVNTYRWDYPQVAALVAPRPLLLCNSDRDDIFPLDGVERTFDQLRRVYRLCGAEGDLGLVITPGPHKDTQSLQVPVFAWMNKHLRQSDELIDSPAVPCFKPEDLKVFETLPEDQKNTKIDESFVPVSPPPRVPESKDDWATLRDGWRRALLEKSFRGWPAEPPSLEVKPACSVSRHGLGFSAYEFTSQEGVRLRVYLVGRADGAKTDTPVHVEVLDQDGWVQWLATVGPGFPEELKSETLPPGDEKAFEQWRQQHAQGERLSAYVLPRGVGPTLWNQDEKKQTHLRRRFMLLGQTLDGMRVWDVHRAVQALRSLDRVKKAPLELAGRGTMAGVALYASLFEPDVRRLVLIRPPATHRDGPIFLNVRRYLDLPEAVAMAAERSSVRIEQAQGADWTYPVAVARRLGWGEGRVELADTDFQSHQYKSADGKTLPYRLLVPSGGAAGQKHPLLVFLHGLGERGIDNQAQLLHGKAMMQAAAARHGCYVLVPQCPIGAIWPGRHWADKDRSLSEKPSEPMRLVLELVEELQKTHPIDPDRLYVMGLSMGGYGTWDVIQREPKRFAAAVPICGGGDPSKAAAVAGLPIWVFHGADDRPVPVARSRDMVKALQAAGGKPKYTEYPGVGHPSWINAFAEPELLPWLTRQKRQP